MNESIFKELYELGQITAQELHLPFVKREVPRIFINPYMKTSGACSRDLNVIHIKERNNKPTTTIMHEIGHMVLDHIHGEENYYDDNGDVIMELWYKSINEQMANSVMWAMEYKLAGLHFYVQAATELVRRKIMFEWVYIEDMEQRSKVIQNLYENLFKDDE